jgi:N-acetylmuramoyl-L-alanine amidase
MRKIIDVAKYILIIFAAVQCTTTKFLLYEYPPDWKTESIRDSTIKNYSKYLSGKKFFLDPGHGGEDRKNKSANGEIIEADVNLRVSLYLKNYFEQAGAVVEMSREEDKTVPLALRSELANNSGADLFISIHHNAPGKSEDNYTNYTSVYYHAKETDYEYEPCEHDIARYIERDLSYVMGNPIGLGSFDGTYSDYNIYPGEGFSVLRKTNIPSVLVECAFHTSRLEELRLNDETFNQIQAWGIFRGVAKYFRAGIPQIEIMWDSLKIENGNLKAAFILKDSSGINSKSIQVFYDKEEIEFEFDKKTNIVSFEINSVKDGSHLLKIICANSKGNHSLPFNKNFVVENNSVRIEQIK